MLGHADARMAERVYARLGPNALATLMHERVKAAETKPRYEQCSEPSRPRTVQIARPTHPLA
jgi:hypothetical protein